MRKPQRSKRRKIPWVLGSGGIASGILGRAQNLIDILGLASVGDDISAWKSLTVGLLSFVSGIHWGDWIFNGLFVVFVVLFFWSLGRSRGLEDRGASDAQPADDTAAAPPTAGLVAGVLRSGSSCLICVDSNFTVVLNMLMAMLKFLDPAYTEIHSTVSYDDESKKEIARTSCWTAHDELERNVRALRGYIEDSFDQACLLPWWHELGRILGQLSYGEVDFRDELKRRLKVRRSQLLRWIEVVERMPK